MKQTVTGSLRLVVVSALAWSASLGVGVAQTTTRVSTDATGTQVAGASRQRECQRGRALRGVLVDGDDARRRRRQRIGRRLREGSADRRRHARQRADRRAEAVGDSVSPDISTDGRYVTFVSAAALDRRRHQHVRGCDRHRPARRLPARPRHRRHHARERGDRRHAGQRRQRRAADQRRRPLRRLRVGRRPTSSPPTPTSVRRRLPPRPPDVDDDRVSVATSGAQSDRAASSPTISDDGTRVAFLSDADDARSRRPIRWRATQP